MKSPESIYRNIIENVKRYLMEDTKLMSELEMKVREKLGLIHTKQSVSKEEPKEVIKEQAES